MQALALLSRKPGFKCTNYVMHGATCATRRDMAKQTSCHWHRCARERTLPLSASAFPASSVGRRHPGEPMGTLPIKDGVVGLVMGLMWFDMV